MNTNDDPFHHLVNVPHFYLIRKVESKLISLYLQESYSPCLDLGCGDGSFGRSLKISNIHGIDIDENALNNLEINGCYVEKHLAKASAIPYPNNFFGSVFANCALEHMEDIGTVLSEVARILVPNGVFVFTVPTPSFFEQVLKDYLLRIIGVANQKTIEHYNLIHHHVNIYSLDNWRLLLEGAGFRVSSYVSYLPGEFGEFVARMDILHTVHRTGTKELRKALRYKYLSPLGLLFRHRIENYLRNPLNTDSGTHLIVKATKS